MGLVSSLQESYYGQVLIASPFISLLSIIVTVCAITRLVTGARYAFVQNNQTSDKKLAGMVPYWFPYIGSVDFFFTDISNIIRKTRDSSVDGIFKYRIGPREYHIISMPSVVQKIFSIRGSIGNKSEAVDFVLKKVFGYDVANTDEYPAYLNHREMFELLRKDAFNVPAMDNTLQAVEENTASLIRPKSSLDSKSLSSHPWERTARVERNADGTFDANFCELMKNFSGHQVIDSVWGKALLENYPKMQEDVWTLDDGANELLGGLISSNSACARRGIAARGRIATGLYDWHKAIVAKRFGKEYDPKWGSLDDVLELMVDHAEEWEKHNASSKLQAAGDTFTIMGVIANVGKVIFWVILYIYKDPELLARVRQEIEPYAYVSPTGERNADGLLKVSVDMPKLLLKCPLLKGCFFESMRLTVSTLSLRHTYKDIELEESQADATLFRKKKAQSYIIPANSDLVLANTTMQSDPRLFPNPEQFFPERFIQTGPDGESQAEMKNLFCFGGGLHKCKGKIYAEKSTLLFLASFLVMWDLEPVEGGEIKIPKTGKATGGACVPLNDVRMRLKRRFD